MYYIEGIIEAIEICGANPERIRFSLIPVSERIISLDGGKKKALFTDSSSPAAMLVELDKNAAGKDVLWFHAETSLCNTILSAKSNRNTIWVWCDKPEISEPNKQEPIPPLFSRKAEGIRVF